MSGVGHLDSLVNVVVISRSLNALGNAMAFTFGAAGTRMTLDLLDH